MPHHELELLTEDSIEQKTYEYPVLEEAFNQISNSYNIEFNFPQGGCQQRSHVISMILSKKFNIEHQKIWLFSPAALYEDDPTTLFVEDKNKLSQDNIVQWNFHTAPIVRLIENGKTEFLVIDPSLNRAAPMYLEDWLENIGNSALSKYSFLKAENYFFNCKDNDDGQPTNLFDGTFSIFDDQTKHDLLLEKGLAVNDMALVIYKKYIETLMRSAIKGEEQKLEDLKAIFGNATALDLLFSQNLSGKTEQTSYRYALTHYGEIMKEAKQMFHERLLYWTKFTNELVGQ
jgi:hypothetical protein